MNAKAHYDNHLAGLYSWMMGDFKAKLAEQQQFFSDHKIFPQQNGLAFDLGAGPGTQAIPLARLGFRVTAVDFNRQLLGELDRHKDNLDINVIEDDLLNFLRTADAMPELIVCMGDTITHLQDTSLVAAAVRLAARLLLPGGKLIVSYRDLTAALAGETRFIPVKADDARILTCFLEYFSDRVVVHDLVHEKVDGSWVQRVSSYPKLRLSERNMKDIIGDAGLKVTWMESINGISHIIAEKTA